MGKERWSIAWVAYGLATAFHETGAAMQPVRESPRVSEAWRKKNLRYWPWYGRGYPQTTWETNYRKMDKRLGLNGTLIANPDRMLEHRIAALTMVYGMAEGLFSGRKLGTYLPVELGTRAQFVAARPIINSTDRDELVAGYAMSFQAALVAGGWA
ncbi:hypothetical protein [Sphingomonas sp. OK281]|uniref:hypothetical protein n=1 Tax=Sphingomonas sp. OK281 TaxID=1881067 RepID=UPI000B86092F|nr:hypothetical protein [Sphingomonas sp. OK281]